eukprot:GHVT01036133.1.p2 GENE.GHVT01036133.1~~GHVT01036133.1.p2  ORF type:complete len:161 (+),score=23.37 GHVT01036133.1:120-602(+)
MGHLGSTRRRLPPPPCLSTSEPFPPLGGRAPQPLPKRGRATVARQQPPSLPPSSYYWPDDCERKLKPIGGGRAIVERPAYPRTTSEESSSYRAWETGLELVRAPHIQIARDTAAHRRKQIEMHTKYANPRKPVIPWMSLRQGSHRGQHYSHYIARPGEGL